ncbi:MAG: lipocalin family protein [Saprospiraceae bacterium]
MKKLGFSLVLLVILLFSCTKDETLEDTTQENLDKVLGKWKYVSISKEYPDTTDINYMSADSFFEFKSDGTYYRKYAYQRSGYYFYMDSGHYNIVKNSLELEYKGDIYTNILVCDLQFISDSILNLKWKRSCQSTTGFCDQSYNLQK